MLKNFKLNLCSNYKRHQEVDVPSKENQVIDGVTLGGEKKFGVKSYLHNFYLSPTYEDIETHGAWYLLPPPPAQRMGLFVCRILTVIGLFLLLGGATAIIVGYTWPHEDVEVSIMRIAIHQDEEGNFYIPPERFQEVLRDPMKQWKMMGFCVFAIGASLMAISLLVPTCANLLGGRRLAAFASGDNSPNEPPIRIYPSATPKFKISPTKLTGGHKISPTSGPVPVMEEIAKVQPDKKSSKDSSRSPSADDLLLTDNDVRPLIR
jgi:hypothetical protein